MRGFPLNHVRLNTTVTALTNDPDGRVRLHTKDGSSEVFDHVVLAAHGDQAYHIIRDSATEIERSILSSFHTITNTAILHSDTSLLPQSRTAWSSWNCLTQSAPAPFPSYCNGTSKQPITNSSSNTQVCVTYNMNILQQIPRENFGDVLVTLNPLPGREPNPKTVQGRYTYRHPLYTPAAVRAQQRLREIQNTRGISYAGAWTGYGFHEDGFSSGLRVAVEHLGASTPFEFRDSTRCRGEKPKLTVVDWMARMWVLLVQMFVVEVLEAMVRVVSRSATWRLTKRITRKGGIKGRVHEKEL